MQLPQRVYRAPNPRSIVTNEDLIDASRATIQEERLFDHVQILDRDLPMPLGEPVDATKSTVFVEGTFSEFTGALRLGRERRQ
ncbi:MULTISPECIES: hypothetical protein [Cryobacterium]|uniref:hypothetical protein n=1 Tax=Cryobacterium TaxID=69578 RepID=UPI000CD482C1|nr:MULTISPECIES: hypothetical protein [Cryobacterium]POH67784.1 hypothetical protein C3B60_06070 [Cryobacterium zongtaii]TFC47783.1 hypothetical protein E3O57_02260 [Cryobacterium sp. TMN-39-2]